MAEMSAVDDKSDICTLARDVLRAGLFLIILAVGAAIGYALWDHIRLPFRNPLNVVGTLAREQFNPANNYVRFGVFIAMPALLLAAIAAVRVGPINRILFEHIRATGPKASSNTSRAMRFALGVATAIFFALGSLSIPTYHASGSFDTFHEGESLGTAVSLDHGQVPYKDFIFLHGLFQDPYRSSLAFKLFGRSIGAERTLESIFKVASWVLLVGLVVLLFDYDFRFAVPTLVLLSLMQREFPNFFYRHLIDITYVCYPKVLIIFPPRDFVLLSFLLVVVALYRLGNRENKNAVAIGLLGFALGFLPVAAFAYSVDRGFYIGAAAAIAAPLLYAMYFWKLPFRWILPASCALGIAAGIAGLAYMLRGQFGPFVEFVFFTMPRYKELSDGYEYPLKFLPFLRVTLVYTFVTLWLAGRFLGSIYHAGKLWSGIDSFLRIYFIDMMLLLVAIFCFRSALGRSDWEHVVYSSLPVYVLLFRILAKDFVAPYLPTSSSRWANYTILVTLSIASAILVDDARRTHVAAANFPYEVSDDQFIESSYRDAIDYLKNNLKPGEKVFTLTSEASWYYFLNQPAPTRFPIVWFATTAPFQKEITDDFAKENIRYVIYRSACPYFDQIPHDERYPLLMGYVRAHYAPARTFGRIEIWERSG